MAILFGAIVMSHYTSYNLSPITRLAFERFFRALALLAGVHGSCDGAPWSRMRPAVA